MRIHPTWAARGRVTRLLGVTLALWACTGAAGLADADGAPRQPDPLMQSPPEPPSRAVAEQLAKEDGIGVDEALRRLNVQSQANGLVQAAKDLLGDRYAGVWFERETGDVRIGLVSDEDHEAVSALLQERFAAGDAAAMRVQSPRADLEAAQAKIQRDLERRKPGIAWTAVDDV